MLNSLYNYVAPTPLNLLIDGPAQGDIERIGEWLLSVDLQDTSSNGGKQHFIFLRSVMLEALPDLCAELAQKIAAGLPLLPHPHPIASRTFARPVYFVRIDLTALDSKTRRRRGYVYRIWYVVPDADGDGRFDTVRVICVNALDIEGEDVFLQEQGLPSV